MRRFAVILLVLLFGAFLLGSAWAHHGEDGEQPCDSGNANDQNPHCDADHDGVENRYDTCPNDPDNDCVFAQGQRGGNGGEGGTQQFPDFDGDGIRNQDDRCDLVPDSSNEVVCETPETEYHIAYIVNGPISQELDDDDDGVVYDECRGDPNPCEPPPPPPDHDGDGTPDSQDPDYYCATNEVSQASCNAVYQTVGGVQGVIGAVNQFIDDNKPD